MNLDSLKLYHPLCGGRVPLASPTPPYWHGVPADRSAGDRAGIARTPVRADALKGMRCAHFHNFTYLQYFNDFK